MRKVVFLISGNNYTKWGKNHKSDIQKHDD